MSHEERSEALIDILNDIERSEIPFVLVGGYAISQFETRFSTDLDLVISPEDYDELVDFLADHDFERTDELAVPSDETIYNRKIELFERTEGLVHPVGVDVLVNGLGCRQTEAEWSFEYLRDHSTETTISGGSKSTTARAAEGKFWPPQNSIAPERRTSQTFWRWFQRLTSRRLNHIFTEATKRPHTDQPACLRN